MLQKGDSMVPPVEPDHSTSPSTLLDKNDGIFFFHSVSLQVLKEDAETKFEMPL